MKDYIIKRVQSTAEYIVSRKCTVREAASVFGVGKSTVHADMQYKLKELDPELYAKVKEILEYNLSVRHLRGGEETRKRYKAALIVRPGKKRG